MPFWDKSGQGRRLRELHDVSANTPTNGDVLAYNSSDGYWKPTAPGSIADGTITNAKLANMATARLKGRATAGTGAPEDLTAEQVRTLLGLASIATSGSASDLLGLLDPSKVDADLQGDDSVLGVTGGASTWRRFSILLAPKVVFNAWNIDLIPTGSIGEAVYRHPSKAITAPCAKSASGTLQAGTVRFAPVAVPCVMNSYQTTGAITLKYTANDSDPANAKITGLVVYGTNDFGTITTVYTDSTARNVASADTITAVSINAASLASQTIFAYYFAEVSVSVRSNKCVALLALEVNGQ